MYSLFKILECESKELLSQSEDRESLELLKTDETIIYSLEFFDGNCTTVLY